MARGRMTVFAGKSMALLEHAAHAQAQGLRTSRLKLPSTPDEKPATSPPMTAGACQRIP
jgi:hypothetical protein